MITFSFCIYYLISIKKKEDYFRFVISYVSLCYVHIEINRITAHNNNNNIIT